MIYMRCLVSLVCLAVLSGSGLVAPSMAIITATLSLTSPPQERSEASVPRGGPAIRIRDLEDELTDRDVDDLAQALPAGDKPWLIVGEASQQSGLQRAHAFLPPNVTTPTLRRGKAIPLIKRTRGPAASPWTILSGSQTGHHSYSDRYAQVAIEGRDFSQIENEKDPNRPFFLIGRFENNELVGLISSIRLEPSIAKQTSALPILSVTRKADDTVEVWFRKGALHWVHMELRLIEKVWWPVNVQERVV